jgi:hypothetical protein
VRPGDHDLCDGVAADLGRGGVEADAEPLPPALQPGRLTRGNEAMS